MFFLHGLSSLHFLLSEAFVGGDWVNIEVRRGGKEFNLNYHLIRIVTTRIVQRTLTSRMEAVSAETTVKLVQEVAPRMCQPNRMAVMMSLLLVLDVSALPSLAS